MLAEKENDYIILLSDETVVQLNNIHIKLNYRLNRNLPYALMITNAPAGQACI